MTEMRYKQEARMRALRMAQEQLREEMLQDLEKYRSEIATEREAHDKERNRGVQKLRDQQ